MNAGMIMKLAGQIMSGDLSGTIEAFKEPVINIHNWLNDLRRPEHEGGAMQPGEDHLLLLVNPTPDGTLEASYITLQKTEAGEHQVKRIVQLGPVQDLIKKAQ